MLTRIQVHNVIRDLCASVGANIIPEFWIVDNGGYCFVRNLERSAFEWYYEYQHETREHVWIICRAGTEVFRGNQEGMENYFRTILLLEAA